MVGQHAEAGAKLQAEMLSMHSWVQWVIEGITLLGVEEKLGGDN